jgi:hypothetical protein
VVKTLPSKHEALSSNPGLPKKEKMKKRKRKTEKRKVWWRLPASVYLECILHLFLRLHFTVALEVVQPSKL